MASVDKEETGKKAGTGGGLVAFALLTVLGLGLGVAFKLYFLAQSTDKTEAVASAQTAEKDHRSQDNGDGHSVGNPHGTEKSAGNYGEDASHAANYPQLVALDPLVTTLANGPPSWIRLEVALIFKHQSQEDRQFVLADLSNDLLAFLRTVNASSIEGAEGLEYLSDDLTDIVRARTHGAVDRLIIKGLVVE